MATVLPETLRSSTVDLRRALSEGMQATLQPIRPVEAANREVHAYELLVRHQQNHATSDILHAVLQSNSMPHLNQALAYTAYEISQQGLLALGIPPETAYQFNIPPKGLTARRKPTHKSLPETLLDLEEQSPKKGLIGIEITEEPYLTKPQLRILAELHEAGIPLFLDDCLTPFRTLSHVRSRLNSLAGVKVGWEIMQAALGSQAGVYNPISRGAVETLAHVCADAGKILVAEGVNFERDQGLLEKWGISHYQGREETGRINI